MMVDDTLRAFAQELTAAAGAVIRKYYRTPLTIDEKSDQSPVTRADREAEAAMRELLETRYPEHSVLGEEYGESNPGAEYRWVLDPIDGTKSFILGIPLFVTLVALEYQGEPVLGVINQPISDQCMIGDGRTTLLNGSPVQVRFCEALEKAALLTPDHLEIANYHDAAAYERLVQSVKLYRCVGDGYAYALLSSGFVDIALDPVMSLWDLQALIPVVRGAGGVITDWNGNEPSGAESAIAACPALHQRILETLHGGI